MVGKTKRRTAADQRRFDAIKSMGCILCREEGIPAIIPCEIHHITDCGRRMGHRFTIGLCCWHHRGQPWTFDTTKAWHRATCGPSLAESKRAFTEHYGTELQVLDRQNELIGVAA